MEFFIRKNATLPVLEINLLKDGRLDYDYKNTNLTGATITLSMVDVDTGFYRLTNGTCYFSDVDKIITYQFTKKNTSKTGRYVCEISVTNEQGTIIFPLREKLFVTILDSFVDSDFCCSASQHVATPTPTPPPTTTPTPTPTPTPSPTPTPTPTPTPNSGFYYGKFNNSVITSGDVGNLTFVTTSSVVNSYVPLSTGTAYGYFLIPTGFTQPSSFVESNTGCNGLNVSTINTGTITINDINSNPVVYNVYRTFFSFYGGINVWFCS